MEKRFDSDHDLLMYVATSLELFQKEVRDDLKDIKSTLKCMNIDCIQRPSKCDEKYVSKKEVRVVSKTAGTLSTIIATIVAIISSLLLWLGLR